LCTHQKYKRPHGKYKKIYSPLTFFSESSELPL
jgi:hypothetical protein